MKKITDVNNQVNIEGEIISDFQFDHEVFGEGFYMFYMRTKRLSNLEDVIPVMISERLIDVTRDYKGEFVRILGQFRSFNKHTEGRTRLLLSVFVMDIQFCEDMDYVMVNQVYLDGYICKPSMYRRTPLGREIADLLLAVNRSYGKTDYIPCICWGRNAKFVSGLTVGTGVKIDGRIQSREYLKKLSETETEKRIAYEVSVGKIERIEEKMV